MTNGRRSSEAVHQRQGLSAWLLLAALLSSGCETQTCTDAACSDELIIQLKALDWVSGAYVVFVGDSEHTFECTFEKGTSGAGGQAGGQGQDESLGIHGCEQTAGDPVARQDIPEMWQDEHEDISIVIRDAAAQVLVSARRDGALLLEAELTPSYAQVQPNGPECTPTCLHGSEALTLPAEHS